MESIVLLSTHLKKRVSMTSIDTMQASMHFTTNRACYTYNKSVLLKEGTALMIQQSSREKISRPLAHPRRRDIFLHGIKTVRLLGTLLGERRIPIGSKFLFLGSVGVLAAILFFPDLFSETILSVVLPVVGTVLGVPLDAGVDWIAFSLLVVSLLRFFPAEIVSEHYRNIFEK
jgi:hypothetical protein